MAGPIPAGRRQWNAASSGERNAEPARRDDTEAEESAAAATKAVSDAIRRQLTTPGSVPPEEQVRLLLADRAAHKGGGATEPRHAPGHPCDRAKPGWNPAPDP